MGGISVVACGPSLPHPAFIAQPSSALAAVATEPPPARVEYVPRQPKQKGCVWIDGEWSLKRGRWAWRLGRWVVPPVGSSYSPWAFVRAADGSLFFAPGVFRDADGKVLDDPPPLELAKADAIAVVDPEGNTELTGRTVRAPSAPAAATAPIASSAPTTPVADAGTGVPPPPPRQ
jgi:hypothetical protein